MRPTATATTQHEDRRTRVTRWDFEPGTGTGLHVHDYDYLVVPLTDGQFTVRGADGTLSQTTLEAGQSYVGSAGTAHEVSNNGEGWVAFVEIELKEPPDPPTH